MTEIEELPPQYDVSYKRHFFGRVSLQVKLKDDILIDLKKKKPEEISGYLKVFKGVR